MLRCKIQETYFNLLQDVCTAAPCNNDAFYDNLCIITMVAALDKETLQAAGSLAYNVHSSELFEK